MHSNFFTQLAQISINLYAVRSPIQWYCPWTYIGRICTISIYLLKKLNYFFLNLFFIFFFIIFSIFILTILIFTSFFLIIFIISAFFLTFLFLFLFNLNLNHLIQYNPYATPFFTKLLSLIACYSCKTIASSSPLKAHY